MRKHTERYFVGDKGYPSSRAALSYAQNLASHWPDDELRSFYVRDWNDTALFRVDKEANGVVLTYPL